MIVTFIGMFLGMLAGFLTADIKHSDIDTQTVRVVSKYDPGIKKYVNLFWWVDHTQYGLSVQLYDGSVVCAGVNYGLYGSTVVGDRCKLQIKRGSITGIIWDYKIVGKTY